jgi:hypothetical protein
MADLKEKSRGALLSTTTGVDMKTAASVTLYTVPVGKVLPFPSVWVNTL